MKQNAITQKTLDQHAAAKRQPLQGEFAADVRRYKAAEAVHSYYTDRAKQLEAESNAAFLAHDEKTGSAKAREAADAKKDRERAEKEVGRLEGNLTQNYKDPSKYPEIPGDVRKNTNWRDANSELKNEAEVAEGKAEWNKHQGQDLKEEEDKLQYKNRSLEDKMDDRDRARSDRDTKRLAKQRERQREIEWRLEKAQERREQRNAKRPDYRATQRAKARRADNKYRKSLTKAKNLLATGKNPNLSKTARKSALAKAKRAAQNAAQAARDKIRAAQDSKEFDKALAELKRAEELEKQIEEAEEQLEKGEEPVEPKPPNPCSLPCPCNIPCDPPDSCKCSRKPVKPGGPVPPGGEPEEPKAGGGGAAKPAPPEIPLGGAGTGAPDDEPPEEPPEEPKNGKAKGPQGPPGGAPGQGGRGPEGGGHNYYEASVDDDKPQGGKGGGGPPVPSGGGQEPGTKSPEGTRPSDGEPKTDGGEHDRGRGCLTCVEALTFLSAHPKMEVEALIECFWKAAGNTPGEVLLFGLDRNAKNREGLLTELIARCSILVSHGWTVPPGTHEAKPQGTRAEPCKPAADSSDEPVFFEPFNPNLADYETRAFLDYILHRELEILAEFGPPWVRCLLALRRKYWGDDYGVRYNPKFKKTADGEDAYAHNIGPSRKGGQLIEVGREAFPVNVKHPSQMPYGFDERAGGLRFTIMHELVHALMDVNGQCVDGMCGLMSVCVARYMEDPLYPGTMRWPHHGEGESEDPIESRVIPGWVSATDQRVLDAVTSSCPRAPVWNPDEYRNRQHKPLEDAPWPVDHTYRGEPARRRIAEEEERLRRLREFR